MLFTYIVEVRIVIVIDPSSVQLTFEAEAMCYTTLDLAHVR